MLQTEAPYYTASLRDTELGKSASLHDTCTGHTELGKSASLQDTCTGHTELANGASLHVVFDHR